MDYVCTVTVMPPKHMLTKAVSRTKAQIAIKFMKLLYDSNVKASSMILKNIRL